MDVLTYIYLLIFFVVLYFTSFQLLLLLKFKKEVKKKKRIEKFCKVSLIIPAYNEEKSIGKTIRNLLRLNYPREKFELIVVDDGSKDKTYERAKKFEKFGVKVLRKGRGGKPSALNYGLKFAKGEIVGVVDCDTILEKDSLIKCTPYFDEEKVASVTSRILQRRKKSFLERWQDIELKTIAYMRKLSEFLNLITATPGPLSLYRKKILLKLGGFDKRCVLEDNEIAWRLIYNGYKIKMAYEAKAYTNMPFKFKKWWNQRVRWGIGGLQIINKYIRSFMQSHPIGTWILPASMIGYLFSSLGIILFYYLLINSIIVNFLSFFMVLIYGGNPLQLSLIFQPNLLLFYGIILFCMSFYLLVQAISGYKHRLIDLITFIFIYIPAYPLITFFSIFKFLSIYKKLGKQFIWLTK